MQLSRSLLVVAVMGLLVSVPTQIKAADPLLTDGHKTILAGVGALIVGYLYQRTVSNEPHKTAFTQAQDVATKGLHKATDFAGKWAPTAAMTLAAWWVGYHNLNIPNTYAVQHFTNLAVGLKTVK